MSLVNGANKSYNYCLSMIYYYTEPCKIAKIQLLSHKLNMIQSNTYVSIVFFLMEGRGKEY